MEVDQEYTQDMDDGELWLPSDIYPVEEVSATKFNNNNYHSLCMEKLPNRFAAFSLLERSPPTHGLLKPPQHTQRFRPAAGYGSSCSIPAGFSGNNGVPCVTNGVHGCGTGGIWTGSGLSSYPCPFLDPVQSQVESFMEARARVLMQNHLMDRVLQNRLLPLQGSGVGMKGNGVGLVRGYGGTGVFLPRIPTNINNTTTTTTKDHHARMRQSLRNRYKTELYPRTNFVNRIDMWEQDDYQVPTELRLPKDWTY